MKTSQWRTILAVWSLCVIGLVGLLVLGAMSSPELAAKLGADWFLLVGVSVGSLCGKSLGEKLGAGTGVRGAFRALMTDAKPGEPAADAQPQESAR